MHFCTRVVVFQNIWYNSSTDNFLPVNSYEGTGRSLSLKLLQQLEEQSRATVNGAEAAHSGNFNIPILSLICK